MDAPIPNSARSHPHAKRTETVALRLFPSEVAFLNAAAKAAGISRSELLRAAALRVAIAIDGAPHEQDS